MSWDAVYFIYIYVEKATIFMTKTATHKAFLLITFFFPLCLLW